MLIGVCVKTGTGETLLRTVALAIILWGGTRWHWDSTIIMTIRNCDDGEQRRRLQHLTSQCDKLRYYLYCGSLDLCASHARIRHINV